MNLSPFSHKQFQRMPLVGIIRKLNQRHLTPVVEAFQASGLTTLEVTMNTPDAMGMISQLARNFPDLNVGAGTVCTLEELRQAKKAGASFIVTPIMDEQLVLESKKLELTTFPGAFTPTEVYRAWQAGADMVKLFPAGSMGAGYIKDILGPLDQVSLIAVGGIDLENMNEYLDAGAKGLGLGSSLLAKALIEKEDWQALQKHFQSYADKYNDRQQ